MAFDIYLTWSLNFEWILTFLHFYSPHPKITFCFIIFYNLLLGCRTESIVIWLQNPRVSWVLHCLDGWQNQVLGWAIAGPSISPGSSTWIWWVGLNPGELTEETEVSQSWFGLLVGEARTRIPGVMLDHWQAELYPNISQCWCQLVVG